MNHEVDDDMAFISQYYHGVTFTQNVPQEGESKPRRRRRKNKGSENSLTGATKRKLSAEQVNLLEENFGSEHKLESVRKDKLASELGLDPRQVAIWFQNRRARWKTKKLEEEYTKLKTVQEKTIVEKCHLESEVLKLKEQLSEAKKEIQRLSERGDGVSSNSPCSSMSMDANNIEEPFLGEFGVEGYDYYAYYMPESINLDLFNNMYM